MSTWLMDLTKFINKEVYTDNEYIESGNKIIEAFTTSDIQTRNNIINQIGMYHNTISGKLNDPIFVEKHRYLTGVMNQLKSLNIQAQLFTKKEEVQEEKVDLTENLNNMVTHPKRRGLDPYDEVQDDEDDNFLELPKEPDYNLNDDESFIDEMINEDNNSPVFDLNKIPDKVTMDDGFIFDLTEGLSEEEVNMGKMNLESGNYKLKPVETVAEPTEIVSDNITLPKDSPYLNINFPDIMESSILESYYRITSNYYKNDGFLTKEEYDKLVSIYNDYNVSEKISDENIIKAKELLIKNIDIEDKELVEDAIKDLKLDPSTKKYKRAAKLIDDLTEQYKDEVIIAEDSEMFSIKEEDKLKLNIQNVSFDEILEKVYKQPDAKLLTSFSGSRLDKLKKYRSSEVNGRKVYLPDSNYEVTVNQVSDKSQLSFMLTMMREYGVNLDEVAIFVKDEFIRILYNHCIFDHEVSYIDFIKHLSPNDLELLFVVFSIVNTKESADGELILDIKYVQCTECERTVGFNIDKPMLVDLKQEFKNIYDVEKFINQYKIYRAINFGSIQEAYVSGIYGKMSKIVHTVGSTTYEVFISKPTVYKQMMITANNEHIAYKTLGKNLDSKKKYLSNTISNIDEIISYINTNSYAQFKGDIDHINKNQWSLENLDTPEEELPKIKVITDILEMIESVIEEIKPIFFASLLIDAVNIIIDGNNVLKFTIGEESDMYEYIELLRTELPDDLLMSISDQVNEIDYINKDVQITLTPEEIADKADFWSMYKTPEDVKEEMKVNGRSDEDIQAVIDSVEEKRIKFENDHRCPYCNGGLFKVDYNTLLFFFITNQLN